MLWKEFTVFSCRALELLEAFKQERDEISPNLCFRKIT